MTEPLSPDRLEQMLPTLRHLAEMVAKSGGLSRKSLQVLLMGSGLDNDWTMDELERWVKILVAAKEAADTTERELAQRALMLRGIPEAAAMLAVSIAAEVDREQTVSRPRHLTASVERLDLGVLPPGQGAATEFEVQGGPGQVVVESDQVRVTPQQFGPGPTRIRVEVKPLAAGVLWTTLKLVTAGETLEVPVVAQWVGELQIIEEPAPPLVPRLEEMAEELDVHPSVRIRQAGWETWLWWVLISAGGMAVGSAMAWTVADTIATADLIHDLLVERIVGALILAVIGAVVGAGQWLVLRRWISRASWWVLASTMGWNLLGLIRYDVGLKIGWCCGIWSWGFPLVLWTITGVANGIMMGVMVGFAQWLALRRQVRRFGWWVLASAVGQALGGAGAEVAFDYTADAMERALPMFWGAADAIGGAVIGAVSGAISGVITGAMLVWLLRQSRVTT